MTEDNQYGLKAQSWVRYVNHYDDQSASSHPSKEIADYIAKLNEEGNIRRIACIKNVFCEGDGLKD